jgi:glycosyltransferase involved in cell wall biosynthesis
MRFLIVSSRERLAGYNELGEALDSLGVETICVHDLRYSSISEYKPLHIVPFPRLLKLIKQFNPDFVMADELTYAIDMAKLVNRRALFHERGSFNEFYWNRAMYPSLSLRMYTHFMAKRSTSILRKADMILTNSKWLEKQYKRYLPDHRIHLLYVGINSEKWIPNQNAAVEVRHPAVLGVFPLSIYPKVIGLLKFIRVIRKMPDVNFYFAGNGHYFNLIKENCPPNMFLMGRVSEIDVKKLLESCDIFVHPSAMDALPRVVKEASLMEMPIIASNVGGIPEIVKNNQTGYLCEIDDTDQWIRKIRFLLDNTDVARRFGKNARKYVENTFDWRKIAERLLAILRDFNERF